MTSAARTYPLTIVTAAAAVCAVQASGGGLLRGLVALAFLLVFPGLAVVGLLGLADPWARTMLAIALSIAIDTAVAGVLAYAGAWDAQAALAVLVAWSLAGAFAQWRVGRARGRV